jgi:hypothetical protein
VFPHDNQATTARAICILPGFNSHSIIFDRHANRILLPPTLKALLHRLHEFPRWSVRALLESISQELEEQVVQEFEVLKV